MELLVLLVQRVMKRAEAHVLPVVPEAIPLLMALAVLLVELEHILTLDKVAAHVEKSF